MLFCQLAAFSFAAAYAAASLCLAPEPAAPGPDLDRRQLFANYRLLAPFLPQGPGPLAEDPAGAVPAQPLLAGLDALAAAEKSLAVRDFDSGLAALEAVSDRFSFLSARRDSLRLRLLHGGRRYAAAGAFSDARPPADPPGRVLRLDCLLRTGRTADAIPEFKALFAGRGLDAFAGILSRSDLSMLLKRLGEEDWRGKFAFLLATRQGGEFRREVAFSPHGALNRLYQAEFAIQGRAYARAGQLLRQEISEPYAGAAERLRAKVGLLQDPAFDLDGEVRRLAENEALDPSLFLDLGQILLGRREFARSLPLLERFLAESRERDEEYWKTAWLLAWLHYRLDDRRQALKYFRLGAESSVPGYRIASRYWQARLEERDAPDLSETPFSYYAVKTLAGGPGFAGLHAGFLDKIDDPPGQKLLEIVAELRLLAGRGLWDEAVEAVGWAARKESGLGAGDRNLLHLIESLLHLGRGDHFAAWGEFRRNFGVPEEVLLPRFLSELFFPRAYADRIELHSRELGIDPNLTLALIREESFFRREVRSPANAHGLMQLLPATARQVAAGMGLKIRPGDLADPDTNIRLGLRYLKSLLRRYEDRLYLALAAYNAGPHRVDQWLKDFPLADEEEFIEMIPFSETRNYVKNILRNRFFYGYYYGTAGA